MIALPAPLAPWAAQLEALAPEVALTLAPWLGRLARALGPLGDADARAAGEPDGFRGLARRGSYERLAITEWGVAELFPDEFVRRAAAGEHLFLDFARLAPAAAQRSIAIVSAGPDQLGAPRLAHLALLVVLARRAAAGRARWSWGVLEDTAHRLDDALTQDGVRRLLAARTPHAAPPDALSGWRTALGAEPLRDAWFIGGAQDAAAARRAGLATVTVRDVLEPEIRALELELARRGAPARLRLALPPPAACARALREPFSGAAPAGACTQAPRGRAHAVRFTTRGRRMLIEVTGGEIESWAIPHSPNDPTTPARRWTPPRALRVIALGVHRRGVLAAIAHPADPSVVELRLGDHPPVRVRVPDVVAAGLAAQLAGPAPRGPGVLGFVVLQPGRDELIVEVGGYLVAVHGELRPWPSAPTELASQVIAPDDRAASLVCAAVLHQAIVWVERGGADPIRVFEHTSDGNRRVAGLASTATGSPAVLGPMQGGWLAAIATAPGAHTVVGRAYRAAMRWEVGCDAPILGVAAPGGTPVLLAQPQPDRLVWHGPGTAAPLPVSTTAITATALSVEGQHLACITETGTAVLCSLMSGHILLRRMPGPEP